MKLIECVPNISEGRDLSVIKAIAEAACSGGAELLDLYVGADTNRSVLTLVAEPAQIAESAFRLIAKSAELIPMREQQGVHPRMGATDVCPFIPLRNVTMQECVEIAKALAARVFKELAIPIYLYGYAARNDERRHLAFVRKGGYEGLHSRHNDERFGPDFGLGTWNERCGATAIGARDFLLAYNVNLETNSKEIATKMSSALRGKTGKPPLPHCMAIGWYIPEFGIAQVSTNLTNFKITGMHHAFLTLKNSAPSLGTRVTGSELVGLAPLDAVLDSGRFFMAEEDGKTSEEMLVSSAITHLGLSQLAPFNPSEKILEYRMKKIGI